MTVACNFSTETEHGVAREVSFPSSAKSSHLLWFHFPGTQGRHSLRSEGNNIPQFDEFFSYISVTTNPKHQLCLKIYL